MRLGFISFFLLFWFIYSYFFINFLIFYQWIVRVISFHGRFSRLRPNFLNYFVYERFCINFVLVFYIFILFHICHKIFRIYFLFRFVFYTINLSILVLNQIFLRHSTDFLFCFLINFKCLCIIFIHLISLISKIFLLFRMHTFEFLNCRILNKFGLWHSLIASFSWFYCENLSLWLILNYLLRNKWTFIP